MRNNIEKLINAMQQGHITASSIADGADIPKTTLMRLKNGQSKIDGISLKNAEKLNEYFKSL